MLRDPTKAVRWGDLVRKEGVQLEAHYRTMWKTFIGGVYYAGAAEPVAFVKE